ncbi:MAG: MBL fold metallo-hydrolase [Burkholderiales bacterium PBB4]|nr:MAG: MBL fold metallo-hydrolase [Burkholderiales bacterium PBB4]
MAVALPAGVIVFERGWLSSNNILIQGEGGSALIDSGYCTHAEQTLALVDSALQGRPLNLLLNTHLHSDHCGGNAALQARYPALQTHIPPGHADYVRVWDAHALSYTPTGQQCPRFHLNATLQPGTEMRLGDLRWQVHAAPGHDPHSVILFEPQSRTLISADALWERGFGVVFPELDGHNAFAEVGATLELIATLDPRQVIPGHGAPFTGVNTALAYARSRLQVFVEFPERHRQYAAKVLLKFKLLEAQSLEREALFAWASGTSYFAGLLSQAGAASARGALEALVKDLVRSGAAIEVGSRIINA